MDKSRSSEYQPIFGSPLISEKIVLPIYFMEV